MPRRESTALGLLSVTATTTSSGQPAASSRGRATASLPSSRSPALISTKPPKMERAAEPEPRRASSESLAAGRVRPKLPAAAVTSAAKPEAEDARRSEEHTSELQSRGHLVCRLLLEKKKKNKKKTIARYKHET